MALPEFTMRQLLEAGVHFGHQTHRWNPKMAPYIYGDRNKIHILDLAQTVPLLHQALVVLRDVAAGGGRILFVGTKRQASDPVAEAAKRCAQYFINHRWLGGALTNWKTISNSIKRLRYLEELLVREDLGLTKKELLKLTREKDTLDRTLGGIKDMGGIPDLMFVIDTNKESIAIAEAKKLKIPIVAILDSNCNPDDITHPIPGNDDAGRAVTLYCDLVARAVLDGISLSETSAGVDVGAAENPVVEEVLAADPAPVKQTRAKDKPAPAAEIKAEAKPDPAPAVETKAEAKPDPAPAAEIKAEAKPDPAPAAEVKAKAKPEPETATDKATDKASGFTPLKTANGEADDLKKISGVGPVLEKKLNDFGIFHYSQIAEFSAADIEKVDTGLNFKGRIEREDWLKQAKALAGAK